MDAEADQPTLTGPRVALRPATLDDVPALVAIRREAEVHRWWRGGEDLTAEVAADVTDGDAVVFAIVVADRVAGQIQYAEEDDPDYRHASIDIYLDPAAHGRGLGTEAVRLLAAYLIEVRGHHRLTIDPAADNAAAIRSYGKVGFRPVGTMRRYERGSDGTWHDGLLMDLLAEELEPDTTPAE